MAFRAEEDGVVRLWIALLFAGVETPVFAMLNSPEKGSRA